MSKKLVKPLSLLLAVVVSLSAFSAVAFANDVNFTYDDTSDTLTVYGTGDIADFDDEYSQPWHSYTSKAKHLVISSGITSIGSYSFAGFSSLFDVQIADSVKSINKYAFASCAALNELAFSPNVTSIADSSFAFNGTVPKTDFKLTCPLGSFALSYAINNNLPFDCDKVICSSYAVDVNLKGMYAYFPYTPACDGTFKFYSTGNEDTWGAVYDSDLNRLKYNDDTSSSNYNFSFTCSLEKGKTYYFAAKLASNFTLGKFSVTLEPVSFSAKVKFMAMADPSGKASDLPLDGVTVDGKSVSAETSFDFASPPFDKTFSYSGQSLLYTFSPDSPEVTLCFVAVDANCDGWVNAKDFALLKKSSSPYLPLYENFINYHCKIG